MTKSKKTPPTKKMREPTPLFKRWPKLQLRWLAKIVQNRWFPALYVTMALLVLGGSTILWAFLSAGVHQTNADQLVNSYLFEHGTTFSHALLPGQHSFLMKWPLFLLVRAFGYTATTYTVFTVLTVLVTVACFVFLLYRIERRPVVFGTLCLALASVLLLVPAQPYAGGLLPVNMAMLTTRNLEYIIYIISLVLLVRSRGIKNWRFWLASCSLGLLIASDKLFVVLSIGGALISCTVYLVLRQKELFKLAVTWLLASFIAFCIASGLLIFINTHVTHIVNQASASPYAVTHSPHSLAVGVAYTITGLLTNFSANPAFEVTVIRQMPAQALHHLVSPAGLGFILNFCIFGVGLLAILKLTHKPHLTKESPPSTATSLSLMLVATTLVSLAAFVFTTHYYAGDARYLTISLFTVFVALATWARYKEWHRELLAISGLALTIGIFCSVPLVIHTNDASKAASAASSDRNLAISQVLGHHHVDVLVGDYWRVIPTKQKSNKPLMVLPLESCTTPRSTLSSDEWSKNFLKHSFAYLLTLDQGMTDFPKCSLKQVIAAYGRPNGSTLIAGTLDKPKELLLFYDNGAHYSAPLVILKQPTTVLPITLGQLPPQICEGPIIMNIVAHQDDDLLFMNPDLQHDIDAGHCTETIYITAGDAGSSERYWLGREQGSEAAYSTMLSTDTIWVQRVVKIATNEYITIANPRGNSKQALIFFRLPDGNIHGQGFDASHRESLASLERNTTTALQSVDDQSEYTLSQLSDTLTSLMNTYHPTEIRTQSNHVSTVYPDHSDHMAVSRLTQQAYQLYAQHESTPLKFYLGYPVHALAQNIFDGDLAKKEAAFFAYAQHDSGTCKNEVDCQHAVYQHYLRRQYTVGN